MYFTLNALENS